MFRGQPVTEHRSCFGSPAEIADYLRVLPLELEGTDQVFDTRAVIECAVEQAVAELPTHARIARRVSVAVAQTEPERDRAEMPHTGC